MTAISTIAKSASVPNKSPHSLHGLYGSFMGVVLILLGAFMMVGCSPRTASLPRDTQTVDGMTIYIGVIPAELVQGHSTKPGDPNALHGGAPTNGGSHHLVVALFDAKTGARVNDARIKAGFGISKYNHSYKHGPEKWLEPMQINGTLTYGNFFSTPSSGPWRIHLDIQRPGIAHPSEADFAYEHAPGA